jgi:hypothetical protein
MAGSAEAAADDSGMPSCAEMLFAGAVSVGKAGFFSV